MEIELKPTDTIMVIGIKGSGKSTLVKKLLREYQNAGHRILVYDPMDEHSEFKRIVPEDPSLEDFEKIAEKVFKECDIILCVEEIDMICTSSQIGKWFKKLVNQGRHKRVGLIMTTRRIADCHKTPPSQAHHFFIFSMHLPNDVRYLKQFIGDEAEELAGLPDFHYMHYHKKVSTICEPVPLSEGK